MEYTREPIIETVITPKEGCKLVVRSSKGTAQEEYFVDALEVVSFGHSFFFRSTERPKAFLVPATDYEVLEVREARMVLKNVGMDRTIKIAGGREAQMRTPRENQPERAQTAEPAEAVIEASPAAESSDKNAEGRTDKKRDRRRQHRRRRGRDGAGEEEGTEEDRAARQEGQATAGTDAAALSQQVATTSAITSLLPPPPTLISETLARYKDNALFKDAFYSKEEKPAVAIPQPEYGAFEMSEAEEEAIYQERKKQSPQPIEEGNELIEGVTLSTPEFDKPPLIPDFTQDLSEDHKE